MGNKEQAKHELGEFYKVWPSAGSLPWLAPRIQAITE
jgi:hypothetical protein